MAETSQPNPAKEFLQRVDDERARIKAVLERSWTFQGQGKSGCGLCGAVVHNQELHTAWHLRGLQ